ncbi:MAG: hypothetical protein KGD66_06135 [Candidatus Lokiarchaeota archaeon]|nr:hypothetical protein [Candidatus Lokiarchaeota archaeon]
MDLISILVDIAILIIILILRALYTNWLAIKLKWESSFRRGFLVNLAWIILLVVISVLIIFIAPPIFIELSLTVDEINSIYLIISFIIFIINVIIGIFIVHSFYEKEYWGSSVVSIIVVISERVIMVIIQASIYFFFQVLLTEGFYLFTPF